MNFERELRERLQHEAASVALPGRDPASAARRSTTMRRRRQLGAAAMVAVSAALIVGAPLLLADQDSTDQASTNSGTPSGLPATGPVNFDWQSSPQGLLWPTALFQDPDGGVYALSTEPGRPAGGGFGIEGTPRAVYRLADDGTWQPLLLGDLHANDLSGADGLLYAVSTGPGDGSDGTAAYLSTSGDGGENWTSEMVDSPAPPSDQIGWTTDATVSVETSGSNTLALVSHSFYPEPGELFPELRGPEADSHTYIVDERGITLVKFDIEDAVLPEGIPGADADAVADAQAEAEAVELTEAWAGDETEIRTVPWSDIGVGGQGDLVSRQLFRRSGDTWEPLEVDFGDLSGAELGRAAGKFTVTGYGPDGGFLTTALISDDGSTWSPIAAPGTGTVVGIGDALVSVPSFDLGADPNIPAVLNVSLDGGATWNEIDLTTVGVEEGSIVYSAGGGPLGLALAVGPADTGNGGGPEKVLFTGDLQDWTTTQVAEETGLDGISGLELLVGEDRVVVNVSTWQMSQTATLVGTPVR